MTNGVKASHLAYMSLRAYKTNFEGVPRDAVSGGSQHSNQFSFMVTGSHAHEQTTQRQTEKDLMGLFNLLCKRTTENDNKQPLKFTTHMSLYFSAHFSLAWLPCGSNLSEFCCQGLQARFLQMLLSISELLLPGYI